MFRLLVLLGAVASVARGATPAGRKHQFGALQFFPGFWEIRVFDGAAGAAEEDGVSAKEGLELETYSLNLTSYAEGEELVLRGSKLGPGGDADSDVVLTIESNLTARWSEETVDVESLSAGEQSSFEFQFALGSFGRAVARGAVVGGELDGGSFVMVAEEADPSSFQMVVSKGDVVRVVEGTRRDPPPEKTFWQRWGSMLMIGVMMVVQLGSKLMFGMQTPAEVTQQVAATAATPAPTSADDKKAAKKGAGKKGAAEAKKHKPATPKAVEATS